MLRELRQFSVLLLVVASVVMTSPSLGTSPAPLVLVEMPHLDQAAFEALDFLQREEEIALVGNKIFQTLPVFVQAVEDEDPYVRFTALWALSRIWSKGGASYGKKLPLELVEGCELNPDTWWCRQWDEREQIAWRWQTGLAAIDVPALADAVLHALDDEDFWVQVQAIKTVSTIHSIMPQSALSTQRMLTALLNLTKAPNPFIREAAYRNVAIWRDHAIVSNAPDEAHRDATWLVRRLGAVRQRDISREALKDADPAIRVGAIRGLMRGAMGAGPEATALIREELLERVRDPHGEVSSEAVFSLMDLNDKDAIGPLLELLDFPHSNEGNKGFIERALRKLSGKSMAALKQEFQWQQKSTVVEYAPVRRKSQARLQRLYHDVEAGAWVDRVSALLELTWVDESAAYAAINQGLGDRDARVRYSTCELLRWQLNSLGVRNHFQLYIDNIQRALQDTNRHVQKKAVQLVKAVDVFGPKNYSFGGQRKKIIDEIAEKVVHAEDGFVRQAAVEALRYLTHERHRLPDLP